MFRRPPMSADPPPIAVVAADHTARRRVGSVPSDRGAASPADQAGQGTPIKSTNEPVTTIIAAAPSDPRPTRTTVDRWPWSVGPRGRRRRRNRPRPRQWPRSRLCPAIPSRRRPRPPVAGPPASQVSPMSRLMTVARSEGVGRAGTTTARDRQDAGAPGGWRTPTDNRVAGQGTGDDRARRRPPRKRWSAATSRAPPAQHSPSGGQGRATAVTNPADKRLLPVNQAEEPRAVVGSVAGSAEPAVAAGAWAQHACHPVSGTHAAVVARDRRPPGRGSPPSPSSAPRSHGIGRLARRAPAGSVSGGGRSKIPISPSTRRGPSWRP